MRIKSSNWELKEVDLFKYFGCDCYCTREMKMRIAMTKEAFDRKISLLKSKLSIGLRKKFVRCYVWSIALYGSETWTLRKMGWKYLESF